MTTTQKLLLIDGSGYIYRAYHKMPPLTRADGTPTGAVFGFTNMLLKLREEMDVSHVVVVFDAKGDTFRHVLYDQYKANRPPAPEDLLPQLPLVREAAQAMNFEIIEQEGIEADDIIATYVEQAKTQNIPVCIVSSDKDLMQLLDDGVSMVDPMKSQMVTLADVEKKFGVAPEQVVDVQALMGDSIDNVPGVPGIGAKTAALLINEFGTLEALLERTDEIPQKKRREMLETHADMARLSKELVILKRDCDGLPAIDALAVQPFSPQAFIAFCQEQAFKSIAQRVAQQHKVDVPEVASEEQAADTVIRDYKLVQTLAAFGKVIEKAAAQGWCAFDVETTSLDATKAELVGCSIALRAGEAYYIPLQHKDPDAATHTDDLFAPKDTLCDGQIPLSDALAALKALLEDEAVLIIGHNIKYDALVMKQYDITINAMEDTMMLSYVQSAGLHAHNMDTLAEMYLGINCIPFKEVVGAGKSQITFDYVPLDKACDYAAEDADVTLRLWEYLKPRCLSAQLITVYERMERALLPAILQMEHYGVKVDKAALVQLSNRFATDMQVLEEDITKLAGRSFNIGSPKQLGEILFDELALAKGKKSGKSGAYVTDAETLEKLAADGHALPEKVLQWRQLSKLKSTYADALANQINPRTQRVHTSYSLAATSTGRLSSSDPNLQNIPIRTEQGRLIRDAFVPEEGFTLMSADYSQIELRLLAHVADIAPLKEAFQHGRDIHTATAAQMFGVEESNVDAELRRKAKTINFGIIYGISAHGLATRLGIGYKDAAEYIETYFAQYPGIRRYMERTKAEAGEHGYVTTLWERRCHVPLIHDKNPNRRAFAERAAINAPLQGSAADIIKRAMIAVHDYIRDRGLASRMLLQVHDELVFEIADDELEHIAPITRIMEQAAHLSVPLVVESGTGKHWGDAH